MILCTVTTQLFPSCLAVVFPKKENYTRLSLDGSKWPQLSLIIRVSDAVKGSIQYLFTLWCECKLLDRQFIWKAVNALSAMTKIHFNEISQDHTLLLSLWTFSLDEQFREIASKRLHYTVQNVNAGIVKETRHKMIAKMKVSHILCTELNIYLELFHTQL